MKIKFYSLLYILFYPSLQDMLHVGFIKFIGTLRNKLTLHFMLHLQLNGQLKNKKSIVYWD